MELGIRHKAILLKMHKQGGKLRPTASMSSGYFLTTHVVLTTLVKMAIITDLGSHSYELTSAGKDIAKKLADAEVKANNAMRISKR